MHASSAMEHDVVVVDEAAAAADHDDDDYKQQKQSRVRLLDAARYVVAVVVTALTIAIVARAAAVFTRPEELYLSIIGGYVAVDTITSVSVPAPKNGVHFHFHYRCYNPSGRASIKYDNVNVTFLYSNETEVTWIPVLDGVIVVEPEFIRDVYTKPSLTLNEDLPTEFARWIYQGHEWKDMIVRFEGVLKTQVSLLGYSEGHPAKFLCPQVTIGNSTSYNDTTTADAPCTLQSP